MLGVRTTQNISVQSRTIEPSNKNRLLDSITLPNYEFTIKSPEFKKEGEEFIIWFLEGILEKNKLY